MGADRKGASYIGTLDENWKPLRTFSSTDSLLRCLPRF
jgi:hypothetical protein